MLLEDAYKKKQDIKLKKLEHNQNMFIKKLKYDKKIKQNKSESKDIKKNIGTINKQSKAVFMHYSKIENELINYIGLLNAMNPIYGFILYLFLFSNWRNVFYFTSIIHMFFTGYTWKHFLATFLSCFVMLAP